MYRRNAAEEYHLTSKQRNLPQSLWDLFCSLKLTMSLLISLALTSIIGTIIPQGPPPQEYLDQISPARFKLYQSLGFFDMYHSWWFILLLGLLTANLVSCSIKRLPHIWRTITIPETVMTSALEQSLGAVVSVSSKIRPELLKEKVAAFLRAEFAEPVTTEVDGAWHLFAQKAPWCRLAVYFVHLSVIVIFIGAIIGSLFGLQGFCEYHRRAKHRQGRVARGQGDRPRLFRALRPVQRRLLLNRRPA